MVWVEITDFNNIILKHRKRNAKIVVYRRFAEKFAIELGLLEKDDFFPVYISHPVKVDVPKELLEFLKNPDNVLKIAKRMGFDTEVCEYIDSTGKKRRNYWVFAPKYSGRIGYYLFAEVLDCL